jgi:thiol:disulfide interchange protein
MRLIGFFFTFCLTFLGFSQENPVKWSFSSKEISAGTYDLIATAKIDKEWTVYSQFLSSDDGPVATSFTWTPGAYSRIGKAEESGNRKESYDKVFGMKLIKFYDNAIFTQRIKLNDPSKPISIKGYLTSMACDASKCLPPKDIDFNFNISPSKNTNSSTPPTNGKQNEGTVASNTENEVASNTAPQTLDPVKWTFAKKELPDGKISLECSATIEKGWYVYSQNIPEDGPNPTVFTFEDGAHFKREGTVTEAGGKTEGFDKVFGMKLTKYHDQVTFTQIVSHLDKSKPIKGFLTFQTCDDKQCLFPKDIEFSFGDENNPANQNASDPNDPAFQGYFDAKRDIDASKVLNSCGLGEEKETGNVFWIFFLGFLGGLLALLTPCVFPMIPVTVGFFTRNGGNRPKAIRDAITYGISIIAIYVSIGIILTSVFGPTILNEMATDMYFNLLFFVVFVVFALSFFGLFEITLPSSWGTAADKAADKGGFIGIFFMAFTLALVSFSCTGPIIGSLLVQTFQNSGESILGLIPLKPLSGMLGFGFALALPFALFAAFPGWLSSLPKSGSWMDMVKVTLGFLELALALKFLSTADMVRHWGFLRFELFLGLWILIFTALGLYKLGVFKMKGNHGKPGPLRISLGLLWLAFSGYMIWGLVNYKPLALLSGLAPPAHYNFLKEDLCPHGLECYKDLDEAIAVAQKSNKPLFVDFTGYGCVNCRKMEETVWVKPEILSILKKDYVVVSLYVDDQKRLFPDDKSKYLLDKHTGEKLRTVGSKWAYFQINNFGKNSQPYYILMDKDGKRLLTDPVAYTPNVASYKKFLECGLQGFKSIQSDNQ